jgi:membrane-associated protease RseP (regulator of RpoE activity)
MVSFIICLVLIIAIHEMAHLIVAKKCGCRVEVFSIGFGSPIIKKKIGDTVYQVGWLLLGGYCKLQDESNYSRSKKAFTNLPYRNKVAVALAGVTVNIIMGLICMGVTLYLLPYSQLAYNIYYFGLISVALGVTNLLPIPALDGSYPFLVLLEKKYGKQKGYAIMAKLNRIGFIVIMILNIACLPYVAMNWRKF